MKIYVDMHTLHSHKALSYSRLDFAVTHWTGLNVHMGGQIFWKKVNFVSTPLQIIYILRRKVKIVRQIFTQS